MNYFKKVWCVLSQNFKRKSIVLLFLILITTLLEVLGIGLIVPVILFLIDDDIFSKYPFLLTIVSYFYYQPEKTELVKFGLLCLISVYFIKNFFIAFFSYYESKFAWGVKADVSKRLFNYYINEELSFHNKKNSAFLINNITKETAIFFHVVMHSIILISEIFIFTGIALLLIYYQTSVFLIISITSIVFIGIYNLFTADKLASLGKERQKQDGLIIQKIQQGLGGIRELKIYNRQTGFLNMFQKSNQELYTVSWLQQLIQKLPRLLLEFVIVLAMVIAIFMFLKINLAINDVIVTLGLFALAAARILPSLNRIYKAIQTIKFGLPSVNLLNAELSKVKKDKSITNELENDNKEIKPSIKKLNFNTSIKAKDISFKYPNSEKKIFDKVNFDITKGKLIGIMGPSGSGKSTIVDIILGLLKPDEGYVLVDNNNIHENLLGWQKNVSYVPQTVFLTDDKLKKNIAFGISEENIDQAKLEKAVEASELEEFVKSLPEGLNSMIGERGSRISGGQRQRIGLARALYNSPELLVLDETTSSLEKETEKKIMASILKIQKSITIILISHDDNLVKNCDIIYSIENNKILKKNKISNN
tara:strand:+ start:1025 stop:2797 length:1773 start_codon:yes stop_codon:yes gene_type:complete